MLQSVEVTTDAAIKRERSSCRKWGEGVYPLAVCWWW